MAKNNILIELKNIEKHFGAVAANAGVNLSVEKGSIHAIIGENGAGKSTAMKILYGQYTATSGEIFLRGEKVEWRSSRDAIAAGIGMVHQHFMLAGTHTVLENILLETAQPFWQPYAKKAAREKLQALMEQYGLRVDLDALVETLSVGLEQRVEILKLLFLDSEILILDEPTAVLTPLEVESLFANLRHLKNEGKTILLITHKLKEVMALTDRITVFRGGRVVAQKNTADTNVDELAALMVGKKVSLNAPWPIKAAPKEVVLTVKKLEYLESSKQKPKLKNISFSIASGEIVGFAGVEGNGQSELIRAILFPKEYRSAGEIHLLGEDISHKDAEAIREKSVSVLAEDRLQEALLLDSSLGENFLLGHQKEKLFQHLGMLDYGAIQKAAANVVRDYDVRPADLTLAARGLSGGNQQKLVVGRELFRKPHFLLAAQPTRGVDVGAIEFIHRQIFEARDAGAAVLLISSELEEIFQLSDRIFVLSQGEIVAEFARGKTSEKEVGFYMGGAKA